VPHYRTTVSSTRSLDDAFGYMANFANAQFWDPGVARATNVGSGAVGLGSLFDVVATFRGREVPLCYEITTYEASRRVTLTARTTWLLSRDTITFAPRDGGTDVTYDAYLSLRGVARVANPVLGVALTRIGLAAREGLVRELNR
jgi:hypothetical protein